MKITLHKLGMLMAVLLATLTATAYDFEADYIYYNIVSSKNLTCEVTKGDVKYSGNIVIPAEVTYKDKTFSVVSIRKTAFRDCHSLTKVVLPESIISIGDEAFHSCDLLSSINIPNSVTSIGYCAFARCSSLESIDMPDSITSIGESAFEGCKSLSSINISNSITSIEISTFSGCESLVSVCIPNSVISIARHAFYGCDSLEFVSIPNSVKWIGDNVFLSCNSLKSINIPNSVKTIGERAFSMCSSLTSVNIPNSVTSIGAQAFFGCSSLEDIQLSNTLPRIENQTFALCEALKSITFPGSIVFVLWFNLFEGCENLTEMSFLYGDKALYVSGGSLCSDQDTYLKLKHIYIDRDLNWEEGGGDCLKQLTKLTIGPNLKQFKLPTDLNFEAMIELDTIQCYSHIPPTTGEFSNVQYKNIKVLVPYEALEAYKQADVWKNFWNLEGFDPNGTETDVDEIKYDSNKIEIGRYDLNGRRVSDDYDGISIIKYSDGSAKKQFIHKN